MGALGGLMVSKFDLQTCKSVFEFHWVPHSIGLVPHQSKELRKLLYRVNMGALGGLMVSKFD